MPGLSPCPPESAGRITGPCPVCNTPSSGEEGKTLNPTAPHVGQWRLRTVHFPRSHHKTCPFYKAGGEDAPRSWGGAGSCHSKASPAGAGSSLVGSSQAGSRQPLTPLGAQAAATAALLQAGRAASSPASGLGESDTSSSPPRDVPPAALACCQSAVEQPSRALW